MPILLLVRHALTEATGTRLSGWTPGVHLSERGREQARALVERLAPVRIAALYSSPLERCRETAEPLAAARRLEVRDTEDIGEVRYGDWTGRTLAQLSKTRLWRSVQATPSTVRFPGGETVVDDLAVEEPLEIRVDGHPIAVTMRTPGHDEELALGFCLSEGLRPREARLPDDLAANAVEVDAPGFDPARVQRSFYTSSSCGVCGKGALEAVAVEAPRVESELKLLRALVASLPERLREAQAAFAVTGGLHATGLFSAGGEQLCVREDFGRHGRRAASGDPRGHVGRLRARIGGALRRRARPRRLRRHHHVPAAPPRPERPQLRPVPKELGDGLRDVIDPRRHGR